VSVSRLFGLLLGGALAAIPAAGVAQSTDGFYGGITFRDRGADSGHLHIGRVASPWAKLAPPAAEDAAQRTLAFGGYRWRNDVAIEAAFNARDQLRLDADTLGAGMPPAEPDSRQWNVDLYTSWEMRPWMVLYGRFGYGQTEPVRAAGASTAGSLADTRRPARDGMNYGVGLRFDVTPSLGLRMEYSRFGRESLSNLADILTTGLPESDQVSVGVQFRF
jgi:opacity protein-like surface antigen